MNKGSKGDSKEMRKQVKGKIGAIMECYSSEQQAIMIQYKEKFQDFMNTFGELYLRELENLEEKKRVLEKLLATSRKGNEEVELNVVGTKFFTSVRTLDAKVPDYPNFFSALCHTDREEGESVFIDRHPYGFEYVLDYLREKGDLHSLKGILAEIPRKGANFSRLLKNLDYFGLYQLRDYLEGKIDEDGGAPKFPKSKTLVNGGLLRAAHKVLLPFKREKEKEKGYELMWAKLFTASEHGFQAAKFHQFCNNQGATVVFCESRCGHIFGGLASESWASSNAYKRAPKSFLFKLAGKGQLDVWTATLQSQQYSLYCQSSYGPTFGGGNDLFISNACHANNSSHVPNHSYQFNGKRLIPTQYFTVKEYEVYHLVKKVEKKREMEK